MQVIHDNPVVKSDEKISMHTQNLCGHRTNFVTNA
jgi:hypothetical protein